jgi:hypothetical protein
MLFTLEDMPPRIKLLTLQQGATTLSVCEIYVPSSPTNMVL